MRRSATRSSAPRWRYAVLGAVLSLAVAGLAELALRWSESAALGSPHPLLGVREYRGEPFERERPERGVRIVVVGDDAAFGAGLPAEHSWPNLLEGLFARDGRASRVQVLNAAERGATSARVRELVESHVLSVQPTWLVIAVGASDTLSALEATRERPWWMGSALARACWEHAAPVGVSRDEASELVRRVRFDFGVELARAVESAWNRRCYVAVVQQPWPDAAERDQGARGALVEPFELAQRVHAALCEEAAHVARAHDVALIDARDALPDAAFDAQGQLGLNGARALAQAVYDELRKRIP